MRAIDARGADDGAMKCAATNATLNQRQRLPGPALRHRPLQIPVQSQRRPPRKQKQAAATKPKAWRQITLRTGAAGSQS